MLWDCIPVTIFHTFFAQSHSKRDCWFKVIDSLFDRFGNFKHFCLITISELTVYYVDCLLAIFPGWLELRSVKFFPLDSHPIFVAVKPSSSSFPHVRVGFEVFGKLQQLLVVRNFSANKNLVAIESSGHLNAFLNFLVDLINRSSNVGILINSLVFFELKNGLLQVCDVF